MFGFGNEGKKILTRGVGLVNETRRDVALDLG